MMPLTHNNNSFKDLTYQLYKHMSDKYEVLKNNKPKFIINTKQQSSHILGPTANYQPETKTITVYSFGRHPKDMLRSFAHEVIHHIQNCEGRLTNISTHEGYSLDDSNMIALEREAYEQGNMCFREFEDLYKRNTPINEDDSSMYSDKLQNSPGSVKNAAKKIDVKTEFPEAFTAWINTLGLTKDKVSISSIKTMVGDALSKMVYK
jgi:hypothetical protein